MLGKVLLGLPAFQFKKPSTALQIPQPGRFVATARDQPATIGTERYAPDHVGVTFEFAGSGGRILRLQVPHPCCVVTAAGDQPATVGADRDAVYPVRMSFELA